MSKFISCVSVLTVALAAVTVPEHVEARSLAARGGGPAFFGDAKCWSPSTATMTNTDCETTPWTVVLLLDGTVFAAYDGQVTVTAQSNDAPQNVNCRVQGTYKTGQIASDTGFGWILPRLNSPADIVLPAIHVPAGGTAVVDCFVARNASIISVNW